MRVELSSIVKKEVRYARAIDFAISILSLLARARAHAESARVANHLGVRDRTIAVAC